MKRARLVVFIALIGLQVLIVGNMARSRVTILAEGRPVTLATAPVDPRDLFRGDYAVLRYEISWLDLTTLSWEGEGPYVGQQIWVILEPDRDGVHRAAAVADQPRSDRWTAIRGTITDSFEANISVDFGIEEYFVPEGTGYQIEGAQDLLVVARLADDGQAVIDHLIVDGTVWRP